MAHRQEATALDRKLADTDSKRWCGVQIIYLDTGACVIRRLQVMRTFTPKRRTLRRAMREEVIPPPPPALDEESNVSPR